MCIRDSLVHSAAQLVGTAIVVVVVIVGLLRHRGDAEPFRSSPTSEATSRYRNVLRFYCKIVVRYGTMTHHDQATEALPIQILTRAMDWGRRCHHRARRRPVSPGSPGDQGPPLEEDGAGRSAGIGRCPRSSGSSFGRSGESHHSPTPRRRRFATEMTAAFARAGPQGQAHRGTLRDEMRHGELHEATRLADAGSGHFRNCARLSRRGPASRYRLTSAPYCVIRSLLP